MNRGHSPKRPYPYQPQPRSARRVHSTEGRKQAAKRAKPGCLCTGPTRCPSMPTVSRSTTSPGQAKDTRGNKTVQESPVASSTQEKRDWKVLAHHVEDIIKNQERVQRERHRLRKPRRCSHMGMRISTQQGREGTLHTKSSTSSRCPRGPCRVHVNHADLSPRHVVGHLRRRALIQPEMERTDVFTRVKSFFQPTLRNVELRRVHENHVPSGHAVGLLLIVTSTTRGENGRVLVDEIVWPERDRQLHCALQMRSRCNELYPCIQK